MMTKAAFRLFRECCPGGSSRSRRSAIVLAAMGRGPYSAANFGRGGFLGGAGWRTRAVRRARQHRRARGFSTTPHHRPPDGPPPPLRRGGLGPRPVIAPSRRHSRLRQVRHQRRSSNSILRAIAQACHHRQAPPPTAAASAPRRPHRVRAPRPRLPRVGKNRCCRALRQQCAAAPRLLPPTGSAARPQHIGPTSATNRLTRPRAGRPVNTFVSRVASSLALASAARCSGEIVASGVRR